MDYISDDAILYNCYRKLAQQKCSKTKKVDTSGDKSIVSSMVSKSSLVITQLENAQSVVDIQRAVMNAKSMFSQYSSIRARNPSCISESLDRNVDRMIRAASKREADMISDLRLQEFAGDVIDVQSIFGKSKYMKRLGGKLARNVVLDAINSSDSADYMMNMFVTDTGRKYHRLNCPYCKNKKLVAATRDLIKSRGLSPCQCLEMEEIDEKMGCVTAFIDESLHRVEWDQEGRKGVAGSFSYVVCRGNLQKESEITDDCIIAKGVDYTSENEHIEKITKAAIEKVLVMLAYDFEFAGKVRFYTDNISVVGSYKAESNNKKLVKLFSQVEVNYVPREGNKEADKVGRERMLLDIPAKTYTDIVKKCSKVDELETKVKELEEQLKAKEEVQTVPFNGFLSNIRNRFSSVFGSTAV